MLDNIYTMVEAIDGATTASMVCNEIKNAGDTRACYALWEKYYGDYVFKTTAYQLQNGANIGGNVLLETSTTNEIVSTGTTSARIASAVDAGTYTAEGSEYVALKGVGKTASGTASAGSGTFGSFVFGEVLPFVGAVATGAQIGLAIDDAVYSAHPDWWWYNVENWDNILLGHDTMLPILHDTSTGTSYITEEAFNAFMSAYNNMGVFNTGAEVVQTATTGEVDGYTLTNITSPVYMGSPVIQGTGRYLGHNFLSTFETNALFTIAYKHSTLSAYSTNPIYMHQYVIDTDTGAILADRTFESTSPSSYTINGKVYPVYSMSYGGEYANDNNGFTGNKPQRMASSSLDRDTAVYYLYGDNITYPTAQVTVDGITKVDGATYPSDTTSVQNSYPSLWSNRISTNGYDENGDDSTTNWVPIALPDTSSFQEALQSIIDKIKDGTQTVFDPESEVGVETGGLTQTDTGEYTDDSTEEGAKASTLPQAIIDAFNAVQEQIATATKTIGGIPTTTPVPTTSDNSGSGNTNPPIVPAGNISNGLVMVYNPTRSELVSFSRYLWSTNFIDLIPKLFQNPMDAIIGLFEIYATPSVGGRANIVCGYLDSGVATNYVDNRYITIDCGSVNIDENFGTIFDYEYTTIELFLPFIGFVPLDVGEVMRSEVSVSYTVDVLNGACNARVYVKRDTYTVHAYSYDGCCAAALPYSAGTNTVIMSVLANAAIGFAAGGVTGAAVKAGEGLIQGKMNVSKSGSFTPNAAAMDDKKPFIVIQRNIDATPLEFYKWQGYPLHQTAKLGTCKGYTKATNVHFTGDVSSEEVIEIENLLAAGVIM